MVTIILQFREQSRANMKELLIEVEEGRMTRSEVPTQEEMCGGGSEGSQPVCVMNGRHCGEIREVYPTQTNSTIVSHDTITLSKQL